MEVTIVHNFLHKFAESYPSQRFGENVGDLIFGRTINWFEDIFGNERPDMMILGVHMFFL